MEKKKALLIVNTGSPVAPTPEALATYLKEFLSDPHIVPLLPLIWQPLLRFVVIPFRQEKAAARYRAIWTAAGSPLVTTMAVLTEKLQLALGAEWLVASAMRYGEPGIKNTLDALRKAGVREVFLMPLFAQEADQTVGTIKDAVLSNLPADSFDRLQWIEPWYKDVRYIKALSQSVQNTFARDGKAHLVVSFHSVPVKGSVMYQRQTQETFEALKKALGLSDTEATLAYQSKFGGGNWLSPPTKRIVKNLARQGVKKIALICPGFSVDCLETIQEIGREMKAVFIKAGGEEFSYVSCLNASDKAVQLYTALLAEATLR